MKIKYSSSKQSGFTLIEVIVVLVILGILASIVVPNVISRRKTIYERLLWH